MIRILYIIFISILSSSIVLSEEKDTTITILQTADLHAYLNKHNELFVEKGKVKFREAGGLAHIKTLIDGVRKNNLKGTLLIDGGDFIQGSGESVLSQGAIFPTIVNEMNYDLMIPGNWEVIYGKQVMMDIMTKYKTSVIVSNMFHEADKSALFPPYWITEKQGLKIGFIAYNDPEIPIRQNPIFSEGILFSEVESNLKSLIKHLREEKQVDLLLMVAHIGISKQLMLANNSAVEGVDIIFGNDTHERLRQPFKGKFAMVLEPGSFGSFVGKLDLKIKNRKIAGYHYELLEVNPQKYKADKQIQQVIDSLTAPYRSQMEEIIGYTSTPIYRYLVVENPMDNFITDALLMKSGADIAISNGFRFGVPIVPSKGGKQAITREDLWRMIPVDEKMKIGRVSGQQIWNWLEKELNNVFAKNAKERFGGWLVRFAGMKITFDSSKDRGSRLLTVEIKGQPIDLNKEYTMASCNRAGEPLHVLCRMPNAKNVAIKDFTLHQAIVEYLKINKVISPRVEGRAIAVDLNQNYFSEVPEVGYKFK